MSDLALSLTLSDPEQAKAVIHNALAPFCRRVWESGEKVALKAETQEDELTDRQRRYYHGVILTEIAEQAQPNGQRFPMKVWKEYFREKYLGYRSVLYVNPMTGRKSRRRQRISTEDLGVKRYSQLIEQVTAEAVTDLNCAFSVARWEQYE